MKSRLLIGIALLSSCSMYDQNAVLNYQAYLKAVTQSRPLVKLVAKDGETIELKGVKEFVVYSPQVSASSIRPYIPQPNPIVTITEDILRTGVSLLPTYWGWKYGSSVLKKAFDAAGDHYNIGGDYTGGDKWTVSGDYTTGDKWTIGGDNIGADKWTVGNDYVGNDQYSGTYTGGDSVGGDSIGGDSIGGDSVGGNSIGGNNAEGITAGGDLTQ